MKTIPFTAAHTCIAQIWQYPPRGLENNDLENDDLENEDLENNDRDGAARRIKRLEGYRRREIRGR